MVRRLWIMFAAALAAFASFGVAAPSAGATSFSGVRTATFGPISLGAPSGSPPQESVTIPPISFTGTLVYPHGAKTTDPQNLDAGNFRLGALHGSAYCFIGCGTHNAGFLFDATQVSLSGSNNRGQTLSGACRYGGGNLYTISGTSWITHCNASINGPVNSAETDFAIIVNAVASADHTYHGVYCAAANVIEFAGLDCPFSVGVSQPQLPPVPPLPAPQRLVGSGTASLGPVHETHVADPDNFSIEDFVTIDQVSMSGVLLFGTKSFAGQLHLGRMTGATSTCIPDPADAENPIDGCGGVTDLITSNPYRLSPNPVALTGQNNKGQTVSGSCHGGTYGPLQTTCIAKLSGGPTATFDLTVITVGQSDTAVGHGIFVALGD